MPDRDEHPVTGERPDEPDGRSLALPFDDAMDALRDRVVARWREGRALTPEQLSALERAWSVVAGDFASLGVEESVRRSLGLRPAEPVSVVRRAPSPPDVAAAWLARSEERERQLLALLEAQRDEARVLRGELERVRVQLVLLSDKLVPTAFEMLHEGQTALRAELSAIRDAQVAQAFAAQSAPEARPPGPTMEDLEAELRSLQASLPPRAPREQVSVPVDLPPDLPVDLPPVVPPPAVLLQGDPVAAARPELEPDPDRWSSFEERLAQQRLKLTEERAAYGKRERARRRPWWRRLLGR